VDLPDDSARAAILAIHARKRSVPLTPQEVLALAKRSAGFSGAELEQAIVAALYSARAQGHPVTAASIAQELLASKPLSVVMAEKIEALRSWAHGRTVSAD
jgi:ATP-dependent Zn protease